MKRYYVYILLCADDSFYTGVTNDLERRVGEHYSDESKISYTSKKRPLKLVFFEEFNDVKQAIELEKQVKGWSRRKKQAFIDEDWERLKLYSKNYAEYKNYIERKIKLK